MGGNFCYCHVDTVLKKQKSMKEIYPGDRQVVTKGSMLLVFHVSEWMQPGGPDRFAQAFLGLSLEAPG